MQHEKIVEHSKILIMQNCSAQHTGSYIIVKVFVEDSIVALEVEILNN